MVKGLHLGIFFFLMTSVVVATPIGDSFFGDDREVGPAVIEVTRCGCLALYMHNQKVQRCEQGVVQKKEEVKVQPEIKK